MCWSWAIGWSISAFIASGFWALMVKKLKKEQTRADLADKEVTDSVPNVDIN